MAQFPMRIHLQAEAGDPFQVFRLRRLCGMNQIAVKIQWPLRDNSRVQLPQGAGRGIARISKPRFSCLLSLVIELAKGFQAEEHLATNFDRDIFVQAQWYRTNSTDIPGYHLTGPAVPSSHTFIKQP